MAFLDNSGDIILDAVLTDAGRKRLAEGNGSFRITKYAFGDDEIDYTTITKFGRTVGKEKITKNTPIFEAQTSAQRALTPSGSPGRGQDQRALVSHQPS